MTIAMLMDQLNNLGIKRFCFRDRGDGYEAMVVNSDGDVFGVKNETVEVRRLIYLMQLEQRKY